MGHFIHLDRGELRYAVNQPAIHSSSGGRLATAPAPWPVLWTRDRDVSTRHGTPSGRPMRSLGEKNLERFAMNSWNRVNSRSYFFSTCSSSPCERLSLRKSSTPPRSIVLLICDSSLTASMGWLGSAARNRASISCLLSSATDHVRVFAACRYCWPP